MGFWGDPLLAIHMGEFIGYDDDGPHFFVEEH